MFEDFALDRIDVGEAVIRVRHRLRPGAPTVVLLHGHPRTHTTWHRVAPLLAADFGVVCPDLRGYGQSSKPTTTPDHAPYSKRAMAGDVARLLTALGVDRFAVAGHDRGSYVAIRCALDHADRVERLAVLDGIPITEHLARCDARFAAAWWHWFFFAQEAKPAERVINLDPETWYNAWTSNSPERLGPDNHADFLAAIRDPETVHAMVEDYRAGLGIDREQEERDRAEGRRIECPTLFLWSLRDDLEDLYGDPLAVWRDWCPQIEGHGIDSGHHMAEEAPEDLAAALRTFLQPQS